MSYNNVKISKMTIEDLNTISNILFSDFDDFWNIHTLEEELKNESSYYLVAKIDNKIVGFAGMKTVLDEADIMNIVTRKDFRNSGIGSTLFKQLIHFAKENGIKKLTLEVNENIIPAIHLYEKFGFKKIAIREKYYNNIHTAIVMQLTFNIVKLSS